MERKQEIKCNVASCRYNNQKKGHCELNCIQINPLVETDIDKPDESICSSYKYIEE